MINKKGMELTMNFIVGLIIALVVFGMGLVLFKNFFTTAENITQNLDEQTRQELLNKMMSSPDQVVIYPASLTIQRGSSDIFGIGILNIEQLPVTFEIRTNQSGCYNKDGSKMSSCANDMISSVGNELTVPPSAAVSRTVEPNKREIIEIPVKVNSNAASGKYALSVKVKGSLLSSNNLVYINIP